MSRPSKWETYCDGRRPDKRKLVEEIGDLLKGNDVAETLLMSREDLIRDLSKLLTTTVAVLYDHLTDPINEERE